MSITSKIMAVKEKLKRSNEDTARKAVIEDLFYDLNRSRVEIYKMNFMRGIFFGLGSVLGGTLVVALLIWVLTMLAGVIPPLADFFNGITNTVES